MGFKDIFFKKMANAFNSPFKTFSSPIDPVGTDNEGLVDPQQMEAAQGTVEFDVPDNVMSAEGGVEGEDPEEEEMVQKKREPKLP